MKPIEFPFCSTCGESYDGQLTDSFICPNCSKLEFHFEFARAALQSENEARELIHEFKYMRQIHLAKDLARLAKTALSDSRFNPYLKNGLLIPVPLHWSREYKRRFNQSSLITRYLAKQINLPWHEALKRIKNTETQTHFNRKKRLNNLKNAFALRKKHLHRIKDKCIILVDDVFTTGSTANECAKVLLSHGAKKVCVLTVLRG